MARVRLWLWSRGCPLYGQGPQQSGRMLSPVVPYSSWARESRMLLAAHLLRAKGGGQGATLSLSAEADWTALAGPGVSQGSWQNRNSLRAERPCLTREGPGHAGSPSAGGSVSAPPVSAGGPAVAREWVPEWGPRCPHALPTAGPECRGHVLVQAARLSSGGWDPFYLSKSRDS